MKNIFCGVDLGGTTINIGMVTAEGDIVTKCQIASEVVKGADHAVQEIEQAVKELEAESLHGFQLKGLGIGVAGLVDSHGGVLKEATNFPGWRHVPLASQISEKLRVPVVMDNDANVAALGEYAFGAGRGAEHMMMVTLGTGVGGGLVLGGKIYHGARDAAGEFGHITIKKDGRRCACGRLGCVEAYVGTKGILAEVMQNIPDYPESTLAGYDAESLMPKDIYNEAVKGDELSIKVFQIVGENLGFGLGSVANLLDLQRFVIGGGVALAGDMLITSAQRKLNEVALATNDEPVRIVKASLGEHSGIVGAASLAMAGA